MCALQIMIIVFGQQLPDTNAGLPEQLFGVAAASTGLASFALVLALVEQVCCACLSSCQSTGNCLALLESVYTSHTSFAARLSKALMG